MEQDSVPQTVRFRRVAVGAPGSALSEVSWP